MKTKVAVIQDNPVFFDKQKTLDKVARLTQQAAKQGCRLVVFPETFVPGYPRGFSFGTVIGRRTEEGRQQYATYYQQSVDLQSSDRQQLEKVAEDNQCYLVVGVTEKQSLNGTLYCSMLYLSPHQGLMAVHRKIKPTASERIIWGEDNGSSLVTCQTAIGKLGGLICWENYMPLARMAMYQQGVEIYIAPTADSREVWTATMRHIALEGRCFVLGCNQYFSRDMYPEPYLSHTQNEADELCPGGSVIISPLGEVIAGPLFGESGILTAELDMSLIPASKLDFDVIGHYAREDIFSYSVKDQPEPIIEAPNLDKKDINQD